jgi:hypothetical protein
MTRTKPEQEIVLLDTKQAAELLHKKPGTLENWRYRKDPRFGPPYGVWVYIGGTPLYIKHHLLAWIQDPTYTVPMPKASGE